MRVMVGICFVVAGLAVGAHGLLRTATNPPDPEPASPRRPANAPGPLHHQAASVIVTLPEKPAAKGAPTAAAQVPASATGSADGPSLVRDLQHQLKRVHCYDGAINGMWTAPTREAMTAFIQSVNARLPTDKPDTILLTLLQGHLGHACGACPVGQEASGDGNCLPSAIVARAATGASALMLREALPRPSATGEKPVTADVAAAQPRKTARSAHRRPPIEGRMTIGAGTVVPHQPPQRGTKIAEAAPLPAGQQISRPHRERRLARHANRRVAAFKSRAYLRPMRPMRYAYRPIRRPRGIASLFGFF